MSSTKKSLKQAAVGILWHTKAYDKLTMHYQPAEHIENHHVFEHFWYVDAMVILVKWTLALVDCGRLVVDVPDVGAIVKAIHVNPLAEGCIEAVARQARAMRLLYGSQEAGWAFHINGWTHEWLHLVLGDDKQNFQNSGMEMAAVKRDVLPMSS